MALRFRTVLVLCFALLATCAFAGDPSVATTFHGVIKSKGNYLLAFDSDHIAGTLESGKPAIVTGVRDASKDPLQYCVAVDSGQTPELNEQIRRTAADLISKIARPDERGRAIVFGKSKKASAIADWNAEPAALAAFVLEPRETKNPNPFAAVVDCLEHFPESDQREPHIRAVFLIAGRTTQSSEWTTEWLNQKLARLDAQLYVVSFDPGLLTGGTDKPDPTKPRRRSTLNPNEEPVGNWYAPALFRVAKDSAGDVINAYPKKPTDVSAFAVRLRNQVEFTIVGSVKDANSYRSFKLTAPEAEIQTTTTLYLPKAK